MSFPATIEGPPTKKRRFFQEEEETAFNEKDPVDFYGKSGISSPVPTSHISSQPVQIIQSPIQPVQARDEPPFDDAVFEAFTGEKVSSDVLRLIQEASGGIMERAVNMYFDGSWKDIKAQPGRSQPLKAVASSIEAFAVPSKSRPSKPEAKPKSTSNSLDHMPVYRYIGAFGVEGWATRSGSNVIKSGEAVSVERQKIQPPKSTTGKSAKGKPIVSKVSVAVSRRVDVIVRFTNSRGEEVGRLSREVANWVSTLIDQKVCRFEGTCVYAEDRIRTNDTVFLQLRCSILKTAFDSSRFQVAENKETTMFEPKESAEEKDLRLRQVALVKLFEEINLLPSRTSETTAKHKRQGLLQAAEVAEQYEKDKAKDKTDSADQTGSSPSSDEAEDGKELEQDQLDSLYAKAQTFDFNAPEAEPADTFAMDLRPYQKQALHWMMAKEKDEKDSEKETSMHPLWEEYAWPLKDMDDKDVDMVAGQEHFYVNPYSGEMSCNFPVQEQHCLGGILADEMGLGKTIEMMSLIHSHKSAVALEVQKSRTGLTSVNNLPRLPNSSNVVENAPCTTLVVAPMSLLAQWQSEAENASKDGSMKSIVYYGDGKTANLQNLCCEANAASAPNVIVTSYGVVLSEFNQVAASGGDRAAHGGLFSLNFFRVILDEAHFIKNRQSKTAKACYELAADHRWVLTGTPIVNRLEDLFSLVRFLRVEPWSNFSFWKTFITVPFESKDFMRALDVVQTVLEPLVLRRTKDMKTPSGEALVPLPPKTVDIVDIELSQAEREVYEHILTRAKRTFAANVEAGTVMKAYTSIFAQILRLRQSCCHPILTRNQSIVADEEEAALAADAVSGLEDDMDLQSLIERFKAEIDETPANNFGAHVLSQIRDEIDSECPICAEEPMVEQTVTGCWHSACKKCLLDYINHQTDRGEIPRCFNCREVIDSRNLFEVIKESDIDMETGKPRITLQRLGSNSSAKVGALISALKALRIEAPGTKSVVFSQFTSFLNLIEPALTRARIPFLRLDGSMAQKARAAVLKAFKDSDAKEGTVLLLSLRAGGVGLNLTMAKRVFMMDPWWSFAVEAQAIDRVHRMGQDGEVRVARFIVKDSVEQRMLKIQDRKKFIASSLGMMSDEEKKIQTLEDIRELLS